MKYIPTLLVSLLLLTFNPLQAQIPSSKAVHKEMHSKLLANAKSGIDKSVIQQYINAELNSKEAIDPQFEGLSLESVEMISDLLSEARTHTGKKYRSGAKGPNNFDCSGFTGYIYNQFGYKLNASSRGQYSDGVEVEKGDLRPGDLVFFTSPRSKGGVGHVGIVVTADNDNNTFSFIHAAVGQGIELQKSTAPYYQKRYVGARRIITE
ncbi:MAG: C40 family peptidase [Muribaculaceae bacterium]|nr:C40 family peptidase [Muribaculaceae bacterium]